MKFIATLLVLLFLTLTAQAQQLIWPKQLRDPFRQDPLNTRTVPRLFALHFTDPKTIYAILLDKKNKLLSQDGFVVVQEKKRRILVEDTPEQLHKIQRLIAVLDKPQPQLLLKARIVSVDETYAEDLGLLFESAKKGAVAAGLATVGSFTMPIANLGNGQLLDIRLNALEKSGHARIISSPEIVALNDEQATIEAGDEVPYQQEAAYGATSISFKKAVLKLQVTPHILSPGRVLLNLHVNQDKVGLLTVKGVPTIHTQQLSTQVELNNQQTFALGGIYETNRSDQIEGLPFLQNIPLLGYLFRTHHGSHAKREMLVFVTVDFLS